MGDRTAVRNETDGDQEEKIQSIEDGTEDLLKGQSVGSEGDGGDDVGEIEHCAYPEDEGEAL
jgi:hypothetical protein